MYMKDLGGNWAHHLLEQSPLWHRKLETLQPLDLIAFTRSHAGLQTAPLAVREIESLIDRAWNATLQREISMPKFIALYDPRNKGQITVDELCSWLSETTLPRRQAILFALDSGLPVSKVVTLTWKAVQHMQGISELCQSILDSIPHHIRLEYVFWEAYDGNVVGPLFSLEETIHDITSGLTEHNLRQLWSNLLPIDTKADAEAFITDFCQNIDEQLNGTDS